jgi:MFS family permease
MVAGYAAYGLATSMYMTYLVTALEDDAGFPARLAVGVYTLVGVALVGGGLLLGPLSDRWGRGRTLVRGYAAMGVAILLVPFGTDILAIVSALVFGTMMSGLPAVIAAHLSDVLTAREVAGAFGRCRLPFGVGQLCGPPLGGWLAEVTGTFPVAFLLAGVVAAAGSALSRRVHAGETSRGRGAATPLPTQAGSTVAWTGRSRAPSRSRKACTASRCPCRTTVCGR